MCQESKRNYEDAVSLLNGLQVDAATIQKLRKEHGRLQRNKLSEMEPLLSRVGISITDLNRLNAIHVSGTKGKGSTCAFAESIMRQSCLKTGLYTSPHLVEVRERMRINGKSLSREKFTHYFFECYDMLLSSASQHSDKMPTYIRFLALMAFYVFLKEKVDVAIIEVHIGGAYDCTNILPSPVVCGIACLDLDHTSVLGDTIDKIAWHKGGIMKPGRPAVTIPQEDSAMKSLEERATELKAASLAVAPPFSTYDIKSKISLEGKHQEMNASLALQLCKVWFSEKRNYLTSWPQLKPNESCNWPENPEYGTPASFENGINTASWPGRCMTIERENVTFYLDGAHTVKSIEACKEWLIKKLGSEIQKGFYRILLFNTTGNRDAHMLMMPLKSLEWSHVIFCPNIVNSDMNNNSDSTKVSVSNQEQHQICKRNQQAWLHILGKNPEEVDGTSVFSTIKEAVCWAVNGRDKEITTPMTGGPCLPVGISETDCLQLVVVGSLYLVGGVMRFLGPDIVNLESL